MQIQNNYMVMLKKNMKNKKKKKNIIIIIKMIILRNRMNAYIESGQTVLHIVIFMKNMKMHSKIVKKIKNNKLSQIEILLKLYKYDQTNIFI